MSEWLNIKSIAGELLVNETKVSGSVTGLSTDPVYLDMHFNSDQQIDVDVPDGYTALVYVYQGSRLSAIVITNYQRENQHGYRETACWGSVRTAGLSYY